MDKKNLTIIFLVCVILVMSGIFAYGNITQKAYQQGINDATLLINQQILNSLTQNGYVPFVYALGNQTYTIKLIQEK